MKIMAVAWCLIFIAVAFVGYMSGVEITVPSPDTGRLWFMAIVLPTVVAPFVPIFLAVFEDLS